MCLPKEYENTNCSRRRFPELVASISQSIKLSLCSEQLDGLPSEDLLTHGHRANVSQFAFPHPLCRHMLCIESTIFTLPQNVSNPQAFFNLSLNYDFLIFTPPVHFHEFCAPWPLPTPSPVLLFVMPGGVLAVRLGMVSSKKGPAFAGPFGCIHYRNFRYGTISPAAKPFS